MIGLGLLLHSALHMDFLNFIGLRQAAHFLLRGDGSEGLLRFREQELDTSRMYRLLRHPQYPSALVVIWAARTMSLTRLALAPSVTLYFCVESCLEERRLVIRFGQEYVRYQQQVPRIFPWRWLLALPRRVFPARQKV